MVAELRDKRASQRNFSTYYIGVIRFYFLILCRYKLGVLCPYTFVKEQ